MSDDLLERATQALRETSDEPNMRSGLTRARLLESAERRAYARRSYGLRWVLAAAGLLVAGTALARVADQLPALIEAIVPSMAPQLPEPKPKKRAAKRAHTPSATAPTPTPTPTLAPTLAPVLGAAPATESVAPARSAPAPRKPRPQRRSTAVPEVATPAPAPLPAPVPAPAATPAPEPESAELALFRRAHRLHRARDQQALAAWDAYLRVAANGALVPEARYNRALCLLRLGRNGEAREALAPFARGVYGAYRRTDAQRLLDALAR